jgi:excisionase family DNA binding protein
MLVTISAKLDAIAERQPPQRLLSKRQAAELLGVSRGRTLDRLIAEGAIRTVTVGTRSRIPVAELDRLLVEGAPSAPVPAVPVQRAAVRRHDRRPPNVAHELAKARALRVSDL